MGVVGWEEIFDIKVKFQRRILRWKKYTHFTRQIENEITLRLGNIWLWLQRRLRHWKKPLSLCLMAVVV